MGSKGFYVMEGKNKLLLLMDFARCTKIRFDFDSFHLTWLIFLTFKTLTFNALLFFAIFNRAEIKADTTNSFFL